MGGIDLQLALAERTVGASTKFLLAVNPALGFGKSNEDGGYRSTAVGISVPMTASIYVGDSTRIIPFVSPGVSMTRLSSNGQADAASHGMVAIGVTMAAVEVPVQLTASMRKLFIRDAAPVFGFALSVSR